MNPKLNKSVKVKVGLTPLCFIYAIALTFGGLEISGAGDAGQQLIEFIQSPNPIQLLIVECISPRQAKGTIETNWIAICWQTNCYILRNSKEKMGLNDTFDARKDNLITVRAENVYSTISNYKRMGVHIEQVIGPLGANSDGRDLVTSEIRLQEESVSQIFGVGIPVPIGGISVKNGKFLWRDDSIKRTLSGILQLSEEKQAVGFLITNSLDKTARREQSIIPMSVNYLYDSKNPSFWFPSEIFRTAKLPKGDLLVSHLIVHDLVFGVVPISEFNPEKFLSKQSSNRIVTTNGISYITLDGITKAVLDPKSPEAGGLRVEKSINVKTFRVVYGLFAALTALGLIVLFLRRHNGKP